MKFSIILKALWEAQWLHGASPITLLTLLNKGENILNRLFIAFTRCNEPSSRHAAQKNQQENLDWLFITVCPALRRKSRFQIQAEKLMRSLPFSIFLYTITQNPILSRKLICKHENSEQFPCLYHIPRFSTAFSIKLIPFFHKNQQYPTPFYLSVLYYHGNPRLLRESILLPDSMIFFPIAMLSAVLKNTKKRGPPPTVMNPTKP